LSKKREQFYNIIDNAIDDLIKSHKQELILEFLADFGLLSEEEIIEKWDEKRKRNKEI